MFAEMLAGWMVLIAMIVGTVLVLGRTHRRADPDAWTPAESDPRSSDRDADRRRGRQELRVIAAVRDINRATRFDRARAELLEPSPNQARTKSPTDPDDHSLAA